MSDPRYKDGDVVWCKCGGLFWPGEVKGLSSLPEEIREGFLRTPLVVVKFFDEDGYEFVLNENNIHPYNCLKKTDFILKGIARFRSKVKEGKTDGWFAKFPKDVVHCEKLTGGNPNILDEPPFAEKKEPKVDYSKIFADPAVEQKKQKTKTPSKPDIKKEATLANGVVKSKKKSDNSPKTKTPKITHPRFLKGGSDHKVRILAQPSTPFHFNTEFLDDSVKQSPVYNCPMCDFTASRVNVVVMHTKSHSSSKITFAVSGSEKTPNRPPPSVGGSTSNKLKASKAKEDKATVSAKKKLNDEKQTTPIKKKKSIIESSGEKRPAPPPATKFEKKLSSVPSKKPRLSKKQKEEKERRKEEKAQLLMEWSEDEDEEAEEFKKIQESINQSLRAESSDEEMDHVFNHSDDHLFNRDQHHYDDEPFNQRSTFSRSGSSVFTPVSGRLSDKWSPLPNHETDAAASRSDDTSSSPSKSASQSPPSRTNNNQRSSPFPVKLTNQPPGDGKESPSPFSKLLSNTDELKKVTPTKSETITKDLFDIDKALEETRAPDVPSLTLPRFSEFSAFKKKQKLLSKTMSPNKEEENDKCGESALAVSKQAAAADEDSQVDDFDFDNNHDELFSSPLSKIKRTVSPKPATKAETSDSPSKFSSLSAKAKAKQLARQAAALKNKKEENQHTSSKSSDPAVQPVSHSAVQLGSHTTVHLSTSNIGDHSLSLSSEDSLAAANSVNRESTDNASPNRLANNNPSTTISSPLRHIQSLSPNKNLSTPPNALVRNGVFANHGTQDFVEVLSAITPTCGAALVVSTMAQLSPAPVTGITQLSSPSTIAAITVGSGGSCSTPGADAAGLASDGASELESGEEQIYYMLVDENSGLDGASLENQTMFIDEAQLTAATVGARPGNVIIQGDGEFLMDNGARTVILQDANGQLVNVVMADEKDLGCSVTQADTSGGVATLPDHPSTSIHSQVPLITTQSGKTPIMFSSAPPAPHNK